MVVASVGSASDAIVAAQAPGTLHKFPIDFRRALNSKTSSQDLILYCLLAEMDGDMETTRWDAITFRTSGSTKQRRDDLITYYEAAPNPFSFGCSVRTLALSAPMPRCPDTRYPLQQRAPKPMNRSIYRYRTSRTK